MSIVFFGSSDFSIPSLKACLESKHPVSLVITTPNRKKGRGLKEFPTPVRIFCEENKIPVEAPETLKDEALLEKVKALKPEFYVVASYGKFILSTWLAVPSKCRLNVHPSLLPKHRGASPLNWPILNGETETGLSIADVTKELDAGDVYYQKKVSLDSKTNANDLSHQLAEMAPEGLATCFKQIEAGNLPRTPQDDSKSNYARKLEKKDSVISWELSAIEMDRKVRGLAPWPGAAVSYQGQPLQLIQTEVCEETCSNAKPGTVLEIQKKGSIRIQTGKGCLIIHRLKPAGKKEMSGSDFAHGKRLQPEMNTRSLMRVLHLTTHLNIGGITTYIYRLIKPFRELDIETFVLSSGGEYERDFQGRGAQVFTLPIRTKKEVSPKVYLNLSKLKKIVKDNHIDLIHAHTRVTQVMARWIQKKTSVPVVTTCHGYYKRRLGRRLMPAWGDATIAISEGVGEQLKKVFKVSEDQIHIVHNGVDLEELDEDFAKQNGVEAKQSYGFSASDPVLGIISRIVEDKGHEYLIRAGKQMLQDFPNLRILIVGDGRHRPNLEKLAQELKISENVHFTGNVKNVTKPLAAMDVFSLPATWREGFGLSIVEAMACRKPVVVSNIWALNTLIQNGVTGYLIEPKQAEPLAAALTKLLNSRAEREKITTQARDMVEKLFTIDRMALDIRKVYRSVL